MVAPLGANDEKRNELLAEATAGILGGIRLCKAITEAEAISVKPILEPEMSAAQLQTIMAAIHSKVDLSSNCMTGRQSAVQ